MKKKNFASKLNLKKQTIVALDSNQQGFVLGGGTDAGCESNQTPCLTEPITFCNCPTNGQATCPPYC